jgi:hypothetical protein
VKVSAIFGGVPSSVGAEEEIAKGLATLQSQPPSLPMFVSIMLEIASLAERCKIARAVVGGVVIAMRCRQDNAGGPSL